jgi:hypothetical protein
MLGSTIHSHYKIVKFLGMGRSGEAYLAEDRDLPHRPPCFVKKFQYPGNNSLDRPLAHKLFELQGETLKRMVKCIW